MVDLIGQVIEINGQKFFVQDLEYYPPQNLLDKPLVSKLVLLGVRD